MTTGHARRLAAHDRVMHEVRAIRVSLGHDANLLRFLREAGPPDFGRPPGIEVVELEELSGPFSAIAAAGFECDPMARSFFDCPPAT